MSLPLPQPIAAYLAAANASEGLSAAALFASDGVIHEDGFSHVGTDAVAAWVAGSQRRVEVVGLTAMAGRVLASVSVSGAFIGSPQARRYAFTLQGERIASLEVRDWHDRSGFEHE
ncbi:nuclear transport factor 2 family protein [Pseudomonas sp. LRF_L74]|uniref:nuclear transport factor 2 family protein n=1 Tax=Pseudomonas sp. LRF_L74 TaxID=3369422 RepID=UPI003F6441E7